MTILAIHGGAGALPRSEMTLERAAGFHEALRHALEVGQNRPRESATMGPCEIASSG